MSAGSVDGLALTLPGGLLEGGVRHQAAEVRPLTGFDEELLARMTSSFSMAERVTTVLARCVTRVGSVPMGAATIRRLTVGDREALLLGLRWATLGERVDCVVTCPVSGCHGQIDVGLRAPDLLVDPYEPFPGWYDERFGRSGGATTDGIPVRFRLPTGEDQERVAALAGVDTAAAASSMLARCVEGDEPTDAGLAEAVGARMSELDPQAELRLQLLCPWCGATIDTILDMATFLFAEVSAGSERLYQEVHVLAWNYHWDEARILGLTAQRRRRYLELIADAAVRDSSRRSA